MRPESSPVSSPSLAKPPPGKPQPAPSGKPQTKPPAGGKPNGGKPPARPKGLVSQRQEHAAELAALYAMWRAL